MSSQRFSERLTRVCVIAAIALLLPIESLARAGVNNASGISQRSRRRVTASSPQEMLDLALYYYKNNDISGKTEQSFQQLLTSRYEQTPQYETAQFYLGAYYQRKFYVQLAKDGEKDWNALKQAAVEYRKYTDKFYKTGTHTWLTDSFFNLALVKLQLNENSAAIDELLKMKNAERMDSTVYIYQVVWSSKSQSVVDAYVPAARLAEYSLSVVQAKDYYFERAVLQIQKWCQATATR